MLKSQNTYEKKLREKILKNISKKDVENFINSKKKEIDSRGLMSYPICDEIEKAGISFFIHLFHVLNSPFTIKHPLYDIILEINSLIGPRISWLLCIGDYETSEVELILKYVKKNDVVLELGGGVGLTTAVLATKTKKEVTVVEANKQLFPIIERQVALNGGQLNFEYGCVMGFHKEELTDFHIHDEIWFSNVFTPDNISNKTVQVPVLYLDSLLNKYTPSVLVIDIEGAEKDLFKNPLSYYPEVIIIEIHTSYFGEQISSNIVSDIFLLNYKLIDFKGWNMVFKRNI